MKKGITQRRTIRLSVCLTTASLIIFIVCCITPFIPDIGEETNLLTVDGSLIKGQERQVIKISRSSAVTEPEYTPVKDCFVSVLDDSGNAFIFEEESDGEYVADIDDALLKYNSRYKLIFSTPAGNNYESGYQTLLETAPVDSFYCLKEFKYSRYTNDETIEGWQFYVDINAPLDASRFYRWQLTETWQVHAGEKMRGYYDGQNLHLYSFRSDSLYNCWISKNITGLYSSSTVDLEENRKKLIPLYFIEISSDKLIIKYSSTLKQYTLNEDAYTYWEEKKRELTESGGIYTGQPNQTRSNIKNVNKPDEIVLGFFWASSCAVKHTFLERIYVPPPEKCSGIYFEYHYDTFRQLEDSLISFINYWNSKYYEKIPIPAFLTGNEFGKFIIDMEPECVDCRLSGGGTQFKPDFWND